MSGRAASSNIIHGSTMFSRFTRIAALTPLLLALAGCDDPLGGKDPLPPKLTVYSPAPGWVEESDSLLVQAMAEDDRAVERVSYRLNGGPEQPVQIERAKAVFFDLTVRDLTLGANELEILAYDASGRAGSQRVAFSTRDVAAPVLEVRSPGEGELVERDSVRIVGAARDGWQVSALTYALDGGAEQSVPLTPGKEAPFALTLRGLSPGGHTLVLRARDQAGNVEVRTLRFEVASIAIRVTSPSADATVSRFVVSLGGTIEHPVSLSRLTARVNGGREMVLCEGGASWTNCPFATPGVNGFTAMVQDLPSGRAHLVLAAYDGAGKKVGLGSTTVTVSVPTKRYSLTYLGTLGGADSRGTDLNDRGQVVGWSFTADSVRHAFAWDGSRMLDLGRGLGTESRATAINASGEVVGWFRAECTRPFHFRLGEEGSPRPLLQECDYLAADVNDAGKVVLSRPPGDRTGAVLLEGGVLRPLNRGDQYILGATRINNHDRILGYLYHTYFVAKPAWVSPTAPPQELGIFPVTDVNDLGHRTVVISGSTAVTGGIKHAYVVTDRQRNIESLGSYLASPRALNNRDQVVGTYTQVVYPMEGTYLYVVRPFYWDDGVTYAVEVADAEWQVDEVVEINDAGVILAHAKNTRTGRQGAVLLTPRP